MTLISHKSELSAEVTKDRIKMLKDEYRKEVEAKKSTATESAVKRRSSIQEYMGKLKTLTNQNGIPLFREMVTYGLPFFFFLLVLMSHGFVLHVIFKINDINNDDIINLINRKIRWMRY
jgi:hypothetical protein